MSASGHYESIKPYPRKPPFTTNPEKSHIYVCDTPARNGTAAPYVFGNSQEFERHIAATPRPSTRVVYVTLQSGAESVAYQSQLCLLPEFPETVGDHGECLPQPAGPLRRRA